MESSRGGRVAVPIRKSLLARGLAIAIGLASLQGFSVQPARAHNIGDGAPAHGVTTGQPACTNGVDYQSDGRWASAWDVPGQVWYEITTADQRAAYRAILQRWNGSLARWEDTGQDTGWWKTGGTVYGADGRPNFHVWQQGYYRVRVQLWFPGFGYHPSGAWHTLPYCWLQFEQAPF